MLKHSIGNDIVDIRERQKDLHPRFIERVCTKFEAAEINLGDPSGVWTYWAAKESAYKCLKRLEEATIFSPIAFEYDRISSCVRVGKYNFPIKVTETSEYAYALCATSTDILNSSNLYSSIEHLSNFAENTPGNNLDTKSKESFAVRSLALKEISKAIKIPTEKLLIGPIELASELKSSPDKIPRLFIDGKLSKHLLSLTHHGRYVACAFYVLPEESY